MSARVHLTRSNFWLFFKPCRRIFTHIFICEFKLNTDLNTLYLRVNCFVCTLYGFFLFFTRNRWEYVRILYTYFFFTIYPSIYDVFAWHIVDFFFNYNINSTKTYARHETKKKMYKTNYNAMYKLKERLHFIKKKNKTVNKTVNVYTEVTS